MKKIRLESASKRHRLAAYQRRHNSEIQLIIRRQIRSGISGVSGGGCEIRAAVKAGRAHDDSRDTYVCLLRSTLHPADESKA